MSLHQEPIEIHRVNYGRTLIAIVSIVVACGGRMTIASGDAIPGRAPAACDARSPRLPETIQLADGLRAVADAMLKRSATFRRQCGRLAGATWLRVLVRENVGIHERSYRARSVIQRARSGRILALVELNPFGSPVEWLAHEFEHVLEQLDGVRLSDLADRSRSAWRSAEGMFETERAIRAGRTVMEEMRPGKGRTDKLVE